MYQGETGPQYPQHRIKIVTPMYTEQCDEHKISLIDTEKAGLNVEYVAVQSAMLALARNTGVNNGASTRLRQMLDSRFTHYLFIDADISWVPEHIERLLRRNVDIVSGAYRARTSPGCYQAGQWALAAGNPGNLASTQSTGLCEVDWCGGGFMLVRRSALERMEYPWFRHMLIQHVEETPEGLVQHQAEVNEDCGFCAVAQAAGLKVYLDCDTIVQHHVDFEVPPLRMTPPVTHFDIGGGAMVATKL